VIEKGLRFAPADFAKNNKDLKRWYWLPKLGFKRIVRTKGVFGPAPS
jgi:hypothetical protein